MEMPARRLRLLDCGAVAALIWRRFKHDFALQ